MMIDTPIAQRLHDSVYRHTMACVFLAADLVGAPFRAIGRRYRGALALVDLLIKQRTL